VAAISAQSDRHAEAKTHLVTGWHVLRDTAKKVPVPVSGPGAWPEVVGGSIWEGTGCSAIRMLAGGVEIETLVTRMNHPSWMLNRRLKTHDKTTRVAKKRFSRAKCKTCGFSEKHVGSMCRPRKNPREQVPPWPFLYRLCRSGDLYNTEFVTEGAWVRGTAHELKPSHPSQFLPLCTFSV
jgi:hypothetical protein